MNTAFRAPRIISSIVILLILASVIIPRSGVFAQQDETALVLRLVNQARLREGLPPLGKSNLLDQAAQRHAEDLINLGTATHEGTDGSTFQQRIREARYQAWNDGLIVNELIWFGAGSAQDAVSWLISNPGTSQFLIDTQYREMGVGIAEANGILYYVLTFGSRPGVLPIFINDNAPATDSPQVAVRLTNEEAVPLGEGTWLGKAIEVRLSNTPDFGDTPWQPWEPLLPWLLESPEPGEYAVYAEYRDGAGRTTVGQDTIQLTAAGETQPTPVIELPQPTFVVVEETPTPPVDTVPAATPTMRPAVQATAIPDDGVPVLPTWTPLPANENTAEEGRNRDWGLLAVFILQGCAIFLGIAAFLRRGR